MRTDRAEDWAKAKAKGKKYFLWRYGVFGYGLAFAVGMTLIQVVYYVIQRPDASPVMLVYWFLFMLVGGLPLGYVWAWVIWSLAERKYKGKAP